MPSPLEINASQQLLIALGDPAGIGMEVTLKALASSTLPASLQPVLVGCRRSLMATHTRLLQQGHATVADPSRLIVDDQPLEITVQPGEPTTAGAAAGFRWLTRAVERVQQGQGRALVTAPIAKHLWHAAGHIYPGQTERLAELAGCRQASMLFTARSPLSGWRLNTLLATTHIPLQQVPAVLNEGMLVDKLNALLAFCQQFHPRPHLAVAGLNPHAGEEGRLGAEENDWIRAALDRWRLAHPEVRLDGPLPPDTCWLTAGRAWQGQDQDKAPHGYLALYHDQGLIPVKLLAFDAAVNTTLNLPFLRTSPDHGTGFDIAGRGIARPQSMLAALQAAWELTTP